MKYQKVFIDFDETLCDHLAMLSWIDATWEKVYKTPSKHFSGTVDQHHTVIDEIHRLYRHRDHYALSGMVWEEVSVRMSEMIAEEGVDFCYPEVHKALEVLVAAHDDVALLTFGDEEYQLYKIQQCPLLRKLKLPVHVVAEPKRDYLARDFPETQGVLVDDKQPLGLPINWHHIWVNRSNREAKLTASETEISDLSKLEKIIIDKNANV